MKTLKNKDFKIYSFSCSFLQKDWFISTTGRTGAWPDHASNCEGGYCDIYTGLPSSARAA